MHCLWLGLARDAGGALLRAWSEMLAVPLEEIFAEFCCFCKRGELSILFVHSTLADKRSDFETFHTSIRHWKIPRAAWVFLDRSRHYPPNAGASKPQAIGFWLFQFQRT